MFFPLQGPSPIKHGVSAVQSSFGVPGSGETSFNNFFGTFSLTYRALVVDKRRLIVVDILVAVATGMLGQKSSSGAKA